jgi:hypothetical protein
VIGALNFHINCCAVDALDVGGPGKQFKFSEYYRFVR